MRPRLRGMASPQGPIAATPPVAARVIAFASILAGGLCGGLIGYGFMGLECDDGCSTLQGVGALVGAVLGAVGIGIVAVLVLRAMGEWQTIREREALRNDGSTSSEVDS